ncbi:MAG: hypothetical protein ACFE9S_07370 [Candidatus Hermodarchaeota archaeon]
MAQSEENKLFTCPKCGSKSTIFFVKAVGNKILIKQKCPRHGDKSFNIPLMKKNRFIPYLREGVFQCHYCGKETTVEKAKPSGPWMLLKCVCPKHGNKLPIQRIWSTIYIDISDKEVSISKVVEPENNQVIKPKLCPNCRTPIQGTGKYCDACGAEIAQVKN